MRKRDRERGGGGGWRGGERGVEMGLEKMGQGKNVPYPFADYA